jgi:hypothetical protein
VTAALVDCKPTFLASEEWLTVPWLGDAPPKDILQLLLDVAVDIPAYLSRVDEFSVCLRDRTAPRTGLRGMQSAILENAELLDHRLQHWKSTSVDQYPGGGLWEEDQGEPEDEFPVFRYQDPRTMAILTPTVFVFPDVLLAMSLCLYWTMRLLLSNDRDGSVASLRERYQLACNICRSVRYYVRSIPGCLVSRLMFVLRVAFDSFTDGMVEKQFVASLFAYIGSRFRFPLFRNMCVSSDYRKRNE